MGQILKEKRGRKSQQEWSYREKMEKILRNYPLIKKRIELQNEEFFPSCTTRYEEEASSNKTYASSTEKFGILRADSYQKIRPLEEALKILSNCEREVIEESYFQINTPQMSRLYEKWGYSQRSYYRIRSGAIEKLAFVLGYKD